MMHPVHMLFIVLHSAAADTF